MNATQVAAMKIIPLETASMTIPELADLSREGPVILTRDGKPLAAVRDLSGSDWDSISLASDPRFVALIEASRKAHRENGGTSLEDLRTELGLKATPSRRRGSKRT